MTTSQVFYSVIVLLTYAAIAVGRVPRLRMNRPTIALVGAGLLMLTGALTEEQAFHAIDIGTLTLLFSMMVINVALQASGFFSLIGNRVLRLAKTPKMLLALVIAASGVLSALFLNDPVCVLFTPLVIDVAQRAKRNPIPYLMGLATAANIGSTATITGNPQNLLIGQASGIPYLTFLGALAPIAILGMGVAWGVIVLLYRREFSTPMQTPDIPEPRIFRPLLIQTLAVVAALMVAFLVGAPIASAAFIGCCALLVSRIKPARLLEIDWSLLVFFCGLFVVTKSLETTGITDILFAQIQPLITSGITPFTLSTAALSNVVSNVPAVLLFRPIVPALPDPESAWLTLAMASTLAGNLTLLGSVANLIVAEIAAQRGIKLTFSEYLKAGLPITVITLIIGILGLTLRG